MKAKKNLTYRLIATLSKEEHGKFLDFVNWYKSEILDFATVVVAFKISTDKELKEHKTYKPGTLRVYKSKLKDAMLEYLVITSKDQRIIDSKDLAQIQVLNGRGEDFLIDALVLIKKRLKNEDPALKLGMKICFYSEVTNSIRVLNKESTMEILNATTEGAKSATEVQQSFEILNFYYQSIYLSKRCTIIRSKEDIITYNDLANHSARYIRHADLNHDGLRFYWLFANAALEYFSEDLSLYIQYVQKITKIGFDRMDMFNDGRKMVTKFILNLEQAVAYKHAKNFLQTRKALKECLKLIPQVEAEAAIGTYYAEYYNVKVALATQEGATEAPVKELLDLLGKDESISDNVVQLYKISILHWYIFNHEYEKSMSLVEEVLNDKNKIKLSQNDLEVTRFLKLLIQLSIILELKTKKTSQANDYIYFKSLVKAYKEKIRKKKGEFELEMLFIDSFSKFGISSSLKDIRKELKALRGTLQQHEDKKTIFYQIQFKRVFDYDRWLDNVI